MASFTERMIGAATLNVKTYEEVEHDESALPQAMAVVALSVVASGIGSAGFGGSRGLVGGLIAAGVGWVVWAGIIFVVGTRLLPEPSTKADFGQLLRTIGFAASPGILNILGIIPLFGWLVRLVVWIWQLMATVVAVRQALDYKSTGKAVVVCSTGFRCAICSSLSGSPLSPALWGWLVAWLVDATLLLYRCIRVVSLALARATVVAVRQALDYKSTGKAVVVCALDGISFASTIQRGRR